MNKKFIIVIWLIVLVLLAQTILMFKVVDKINHIQDVIGITNNG